MHQTCCRSYAVGSMVDPKRPLEWYLTAQKAEITQGSPQLLQVVTCTMSISDDKLLFDLLATDVSRRNKSLNLLDTHIRLLPYSMAMVKQSHNSRLNLYSISFPVAFVTLLVYDYILTFGEEVKFL